MEGVDLMNRPYIICHMTTSLDGKVDVTKLQPITFDPVNHHYLVLGQKVGQAFHDGVALK